MTPPKILAFAGSAREASFNKRLARAAAAVAETAGADVTFVDLRDLPMPLYDGDLEAASGLPEHARTFKGLLREHDGFIVSCPEYNGSITPLLKNAIDWASRPESKEEPSLVAFRGKTAALLAASPGGLGGIRGLAHVRTILSGIGVHVIPDQVAIGSAYTAFDEFGGLVDEGARKRLDRAVNALVETTRRLAVD